MLTPLGRLFHRFQLICTRTLKRIEKMQRFCFEVQMRTGRPTTGIPTKTNDLAAVVGTSGSASTEMAITRLDACPGQMKRPSMGGCPATPTDAIMSGTHRATNTAGDVQGWMVLFDALGHHTRHRHKQRGKQTQQAIKTRIERES